jgi:tRNA(fMet)-specific endonuclease VapC
MYLLDTNICIFIINRKPAHVLERFREAVRKKVYLSSITIAELQFGVYNSRNIEKNRIALTEFAAPFYVLNFDDEDAEEYGRLRSYLTQKGTIIGPYDMMLAAQAIAKDLVLVTDNVGEFSRIKDLRIEDWKRE